MRSAANQPVVIEHLSEVFRAESMISGELHAFVTSFRDNNQHAGKIVLALVSNRIELESNRDFLASGQRATCGAQPNSQAGSSKSSFLHKVASRNCIR